MKAAILIFDRLTALDAVGPYEVLSRVPDVEVTFVAPEAGPKRTDTDRLALVADATLEDLAEPEILLIPGGDGNRPLLGDERVLGWVREAHAHASWTTSVCTGSLVLAAAGILDGKRATSHWAYRDLLSNFGATPVAERVVEDDGVITCAGVSAGIDLALTLAARIGGEDLGKAIQLWIEYDPDPPFDSGSPEKATPEVAAVARSLDD